MTPVDLDESVLAGLRDKLDDRVVDQLVGLFGECVNERRADLAGALEAGDRPAAERALHSIKGSAQLVGARRLEETAAKWEQRARQGEHALTNDALLDVADACDGALRALEGLRS